MSVVAGNFLIWTIFTGSRVFFATVPLQAAADFCKPVSDSHSQCVGSGDSRPVISRPPPTPVTTPVTASSMINNIFQSQLLNECIFGPRLFSNSRYTLDSRPDLNASIESILAIERMMYGRLEAVFSQCVGPLYLILSATNKLCLSVLQ